MAMHERSRADQPAQAPMTSPVNWALLGLIIERPSYAYEFARRFECTYDGVLSLSSISHAYTALGSLCERALAEEIPGTRSGRQPKPHYRATPLGIEQYRNWLIRQIEEDRRRQRLSAIQLAGLARDPGAALDVISRYEQARSEEAGRIPIPMRNGNQNGNGAQGHNVSELTDRILSEENRLAVTAKLEWLQYVREELVAAQRSLKSES
jgi:DNA-binding PadR family transcriptional regulator